MYAFIIQPALRIGFRPCSSNVRNPRREKVRNGCTDLWSKVPPVSAEIPTDVQPTGTKDHTGSYLCNVSAGGLLTSGLVNSAAHPNLLGNSS